MKSLPLFLLGLAMTGLLLPVTVTAQKASMKKDPAVTPDSLINHFTRVWNARDTSAVANVFSEKAVFLYRDWTLSGRPAIMANWVKATIFSMENLKLTNITSDITGDMAFISGFYTFDLKVEGQDILKADGNYTAVYKKQPDNTWKMELMHQGDLRPE